MAGSKGDMVECLYCKGTLMRKKVSNTATREGYHLIIDDVPAWVCERCGEPLLDEETVDAVQDTLQEINVRAEKLALDPSQHKRQHNVSADILLRALKLLARIAA